MVSRGSALLSSTAANEGKPVSHSSFDQKGAYFVPSWLERLFWVAFVLHFVVSAFFGGWFAGTRGTILSAIRFFWLTLTYTVIGCAFHAACNIPRPHVLYSDAKKTVSGVVRNSFFAGLLVGAPISALLIGIEIYGW